jgi:hypothetical protein
MPTTKEFNIQLENRPGTLAKLCKGLGDRKVNIVAFQASTAERRGQVHLVVDNLASAKSVLDAEGLTHTENDVAQVALAKRPGELARVAGKLDENNISISYAYGGIDPSTNIGLLFCGATEVGRAAQLLDQTTSAAVGRQPSRLSIAGMASCRGVARLMPHEGITFG